MSEPWKYSTTHKNVCKVIEKQALWGQTLCRVWLPDTDTVVKVPLDSLRPLSGKPSLENDSSQITYVASAAKIAEVLENSSSGNEGHVLLAPMESNVIPLPHQIQALSRALSNNRIRYLLADEVGLGKTIEAGLILRELKLRGLVQRTLVVAPKGLATQWVAEMQTHFNEIFRLIMPDDLKVMRRLWLEPETKDFSETESTNDPQGYLFPTLPNAWTHFDQVIVSLDSVKPIDRRHGWTDDKIAEYNRIRFEDLVTAGWDLVIVDEAHRLGGSSDQVARYKLGKGLSEAAPYVLFLSATPHQGKTDAFHRLMSLLDADTFFDPSSISRERVSPYVIRTEKRKSVNPEGNPLFKPRKTVLVPIKWKPNHKLQQNLYDAVTDYARDGYNQAMMEKKRHIGFLMILMQRLVVSSTRAIRTTLQRRLEVLKSEKQSYANKLKEFDLPDEEVDEFYDLDGQELLNELLNARITSLQNETSHVETLLTAAINAEQSSDDAKAESLIEWIYQLQSQEKEPELKVLIFTEFVPTQEMLKEFLTTRGISVTCLNGSMDMIERQAVQEAFRDKARVLISTDAGGEGLNLQFCHVIVNFDLPWNPMRLEQRIGRVDRIGQSKTVQAINFVFEDSVEFRVREVLEEKLSVILEEFGVDKTGDVLDSSQAGELFEELFISALNNPEEAEKQIEHTVEVIREEIREIKEESAIYGISDEPDVLGAERLRTHPLPHWVESMTTAYIDSHGGQAIRKKYWWELKWPNGETQKKVVFNVKDANHYSGVSFLNLESNHVRGLALNLPHIVEGQPVPCVTIESLPQNLTGNWGLYEILLQTGISSQFEYLRLPQKKRRFLSVFVTDEGKVFLPTARHIWDSLQANAPIVHERLPEDTSQQIFEKLNQIAIEQGNEQFHNLEQEHFKTLVAEEKRGQYSFDSRRKAIEKIGLPEVRNYRLRKIEKEYHAWKSELNLAKQIIPEIKCLLLMRIQNKEGNE